MNSKKLAKRIDEWLKDTSKWLDVSKCGLVKWPNELEGKESLIVTLKCDNNQLTSLPVFPNLTYLDCSDNQLTSLPILPKLTNLNCCDNQLTSLPIYHNLIVLDCDYNQLTSLPVYLNLAILYCHDNRLTSLPVYPNLVMLYCQSNQLTSLPVYPNLTYLSSFRNQLIFDDVEKWKKIWRLQNLKKSELRNRGLRKVLKIMRLRLYLPRLNELEHELVWSPNHPGKFYKSLRLGDWSFENKVNKVNKTSHKKPTDKNYNK